MSSQSVFPTRIFEYNLTMVITLTSGPRFSFQMSFQCKRKINFQQSPFLSQCSLSAGSFYPEMFYIDKTLMTFWWWVRGYSPAGWLWLLPHFWPSTETWYWILFWDSGLWPKLIAISLHSPISSECDIGAAREDWLYPVTGYSTW